MISLYYSQFIGMQSQEQSYIFPLRGHMMDVKKDVSKVGDV
jgi:hypothetical protein